jgi:hypothetical protein
LSGSHVQQFQNIERKVITFRNGHFTPFMSAMADPAARKRIQTLEEWAVQRDREIAELSSTVWQLATTVEAIRTSNLQPASIR